MLRGMAILLVMALHFSLTYKLWTFGPLAQLFGAHLVRAILGPANFGVTMFFVISGFLITTHAIEQNGSLAAIRLRDFYVRRFARIAPCLLVAAAIIIACGICGIPSFRDGGNAARPNHDVLIGALAVLGCCENILMQKLGYFNYCLNIYWSLSVEEAFYLGFPVICICLRRDWLIIAAALACVIAAPLYRAAHAGNEIYYLYADPACFDAIAIGCITGLISRHWRPTGLIAASIGITGIILLVWLWYRGFDGHEALSFTGLAAATSAIILAGLDTPLPRWRRVFPARQISWSGWHSYELYLFHIIILAIMRDLVPCKNLAPVWQLPWLAMFLALSSLVAWQASERIGEPANRALRRLLLRDV